MDLTPEQEKKNSDREAYSKALRAWYAAYKNVRLYSPAHPSTADAAQKLVALLNEIFKIRFDFTLQHVDGLFVVDDILLIEESLSFYDLIRVFEKTDIGKVTFLPGLTLKEIVDLSAYMVQTDSKTADGAREGFTSEHVKTTIGSPTKNEEEIRDARHQFNRSALIIEDWHAVLEKTFSKLIEEQNLLLADLSIPLDKLIDAVGQRPGDFSVLMTTRLKSPLHHQHALNTMIISVYIGHQLNLDIMAMKILAISALLHDVGRFFLPTEFTTNYELCDGDTDFIRLHARDGASFLTGVQGLPMSVVRAAFEHHLGTDGIGYPHVPAEHKPYLFSQIIGLADFVSWATVSEKHYHRPKRLHRIVHAVLRRSGTQFSPLLVKLFVPFFGLYPPGTIVDLNTGERGIVMLPNQTHIARPLVLVKTTGDDWIAKDLSMISDDPNSPFPLSIQRTIEYHTDLEPLIDFLPDPKKTS